MNRIIVQLPPYFQLIRDYVELGDTETVELDLMDQAIQQLFNDQFVMTSSERAVRRREQLLGIQADPTTETLEFRKKRIINRYSTKPPFTLRFLQKRLDDLVGPGRAIVSVDVQNFVLKVTAAIDEAAVFKEVERTVATTIPANLIYQQNTALEDLILLEEHITMRDLTRNIRLSTTWHLGVTPFAVAGPEVVIK